MASLFDIREWGGSQHRAWEELAFQVRDHPSGVVETRKTKAPDGGVEWYHVFADGHHEGFQAKFYADLASALGDMRKSVVTVASSRPEMTRMTFVVPFDFTDHSSSKFTSDQDRWDAGVARWKRDIPGADRLEFGVVRGGEVLERLTREEHAGRRSFWFEDIDLSWNWLRNKWTESAAIAGDRYTPAAHTAIDLEQDVAAACLADSYLVQLTTIAQQAIDEVIEAAPTWSDRREDLVGHARRLRGAVDLAVASVPTLDVAELGAREADATRFLELLYEEATRSDDPGLDRHRLRRALAELASLRHFLSSRGTDGAVAGVVAISGSAGQGKTHLLLQAASDLLAAETPAIVLMGQRFSSGAWWPDVRAQLGLGDVDIDGFLGGLSSMAEATGRRALIFIDALNESRDPRSWAAELPSLLDTTARYPWLGVVLTWRTDYQDLILGDLGLKVTRHPGLAGVEPEALANYCELFGVAVPDVAVFDSAFSNPLFLRMYCELIADDPAVGIGSEGRSQIFTQFARLKSRAVIERLRLSPSTVVVHTAIELLADALITTDGRPIPRAELEPEIDALVPDRTAWPDTLFGSMRSVGLVETFPTYDGGEVVAFPFQAFSEHLVVGRLLDRLSDDGTDLTEEARRSVADYPGLWRSAAVLLPERYGLELVDLVDASGQDWRLGDVLINSLIDRSPNSFSPRAQALLLNALDDPEWGPRALEAVLALAPRGEHPCNAWWLHEYLMRLGMADRDASWGIRTFDVLDESATYERMVAWALRGDSRSTDAQVVMSTIPMVWMLTSPNRRLRDHTTKVLIELLRSRLPALRELLVAFETVDDLYVTERILLIAYGCMMRGGDGDHAGAAGLAEEIARLFRDEQIPVHVLARDAARGAIAWANSRGLVSDAELAHAVPPYGAHPPEDPPTSEQLQADFGRSDDDPPDWRAQSILSSCLDWMGDFNKYVIAGDVDTFSLHPLDGARPTERAHADPLGEVDANWAGRWVAWKAIERGWTPERFAAFEHNRDLHSGRDAHKAERFGKKYQWQALHELLARLADNFHPSVQWDDGPTSYEGPWGWFGRDLDPSLPASSDIDGQLLPRVALEEDDADWVPPSPDLHSAGGPLDWASDTRHFPATADLAVHRSSAGEEWVALYRHSAWTRRPDRSSRWGWDRQQWILQFSWLTRRGDGRALFEMLNSESLFGRWMPERHRPRRAYLGEGPWSPIDHAEPSPWVPASKRWDDAGAIAVLPATEEYLWEGTTQDCSLDNSVSLALPTGLLLGDARWLGTNAEWATGDTVDVHAARTPDGHREHTVLLARAPWLEARLATLELELVVGVLGERQAMDENDDMDLRAWTEITSAALLRPGEGWEFCGPRVDIHSRGPEGSTNDE